MFSRRLLARMLSRRFLVRVLSRRFFGEDVILWILVEGVLSSSFCGVLSVGFFFFFFFFE